MLVAYHAQPRSSDADKVTLLAFLTLRGLDPAQPADNALLLGGRPERSASPTP